MIYRNANPNDAEAIAALHARSWQSAYKGILSDDYLLNKVPAERYQIWMNRLSSIEMGQIVLVSEANHTLAGFVCMYLEHDDQYGALLDNLHVAPEYQRQGIGRELMKQAIRVLQDSDERSGMYLWVLCENSSAISFYQSIGGQLADERPYPGLGDTPVPAIRIIWDSSLIAHF